MEIKEEEPEDDLLLVLTEDGGVKNEEDPVADRLENQTILHLGRHVLYKLNRSADIWHLCSVETKSKCGYLASMFCRN